MGYRTTFAVVVVVAVAAAVESLTMMKTTKMRMSTIDRLEFVRRFPSLDLFLPQESPPRRIAKKTTLSANEVGEEAGKAVIG